MKKLLTWISKGSKVIKILTYLYTGLNVVKAAISAGVEQFKEDKPDVDESKYKFMGQALEYIGLAISALDTLLDWFGIDAKSIEAAEPKDLNAQLEAEINKLKEIK